MSKPKGATRRMFLGSELVGSVAKLPSRLEFDDDDSERPPQTPDLGEVARLARLAQRGVLDYICIDETLAGNPPFSGRRRGGLDSVRLATRLAPATDGVYLVPLVHANRVAPSSLLEALISLEIASSGRHGWELAWQAGAPAQGHGGELLAAIVEDTWSAADPLTRLAASARAFRRQQLDWSRQGGAKGCPPRHPVQVMRADAPEAVALAGLRAHLARVAAASQDDAAAKRAALRAAALEAGRDPDSLRVLVDLSVTLAGQPAQAEARKDLAEEITGERLGGDGIRFVGTPAALAQACAEWVAAEACDGFTFLPTSLPVDLMLLVGGVTPALAAAGHRPAAYQRGGRRGGPGRVRPLSGETRRPAASRR
ncbi:MAG: LLM class flavin-dependent oxidoreductase [Bifidobacteriaceae bacterium]|jgi:alkanesulfonate monooxygenase SsuD/methylene tetrahydromethanopterin reductase-like flavin-dependent oxidoreductase (luciferase family)|nr:LLM class flavin-dependent oxidoreductase [Bifidobacteriaceae bacterium]